MKKNLLIICVTTIVFSLVLGLTMTSYAGKEEKEVVEIEKKPIEELVVAISETWTEPDITYWTPVECQMQLQLVYNGLLDYDENMQLVPSLAESWDILEDGKKYIFHLRKGVKWHNGREFVAKDVKFSLERVMGWIPPNKPGLRVRELGDVKSIDVVDDYTVEVTLNQPFSPFLYGVASAQRAIVCPENFTPEGKIKEGEIIGTGPYKLVELVMPDYFKIESFDDYWGGTPKVKTIIFKAVPDDTVRLTALKTGDVDIILNPPMESYRLYLDSPAEDYILAAVPNSEKWAYAFGLNTNKKPFDNKLVRQAIAHAIDVKEFIDIATSGTGKETTDLWFKGFIWSSDIPRLRYDTKLAKSLLTKAGYPNGFETTIHTTDFINFTTNAEILQSQLAKIGIKATINKVEFAEWAKDERNANFDIHTQTWMFTADPNILYGTALESGCVYPAWFGGGWTNSEIDKLLREAKAEFNQDKRIQLYKEVNKILVDEAPVIWLYTAPNLYGIRSNITELKFNVRGDFIHNNNVGIMNLEYK